jgi:hypothetical protein
MRATFAGCCARAPSGHAAAAPPTIPPTLVARADEVIE